MRTSTQNTAETASGLDALRAIGSREFFHARDLPECVTVDLLEVLEGLELAELRSSGSGAYHQLDRIPERAHQVYNTVAYNLTPESNTLWRLSASGKRMLAFVELLVTPTAERQQTIADIRRQLRKPHMGPGSRGLLG